MISEAIILAGGLGTRLREAVPDLPKCMAPVAGRPFIAFVIDELRMQGIRRIIFSLGFRADAVKEFLQAEYPTLEYAVVEEFEPLGTGGAIRLALHSAGTRDVLIVNGDTLFRIDVAELEQIHADHASDCTLALKPMHDFDRYGVVEIDPENRILSFREKNYYTEGLINGGCYLIQKQAFLSKMREEKFSFEKDYLEKFSSEQNFYGSVQDAYFIDIGIPEDFTRAGQELHRPELALDLIDTTWTLFLDRDGVINEEKVGAYVQHWNEFIFNARVLHVFKKLSDHFARIIIVSNQRGIGKGLMTREDLDSIHFELKREVEIVGGRIDQIYYCPDKHTLAFDRKPNPGMALQAAREFPEIDFAKSIMVGNKPSDMRFGRNAGMYTVFVKTTDPDSFQHGDIDAAFDTLADFADALPDLTS